MSRIKPITRGQNSDLDALFEQGEAFMGFQPNDGLLMGHRPKMLISFFDLVKEVYAEGKVDNGLKRLVGHLTSLSAGCQYCSAHTSYSAKKLGVSEGKLKAIWDFKSSPLFSEKEKAALNIALKAGMVPNQVTNEDFMELKKHFDEEAIVEIVGVISLFGFLNRWNTTLDTELEAVPKTHYESIKNKK